jgi:hypothetical protein
MIVAGYQDGHRSGQRRVVVRDLVGGRNIKAEPVADTPEYRGQGLQKLWWTEKGGHRAERLVTKDVAATAPPPTSLAVNVDANGNGTGANSGATTSTVAAATSSGFPSDGGVGDAARAVWSWFPKAEDELLFPKGAEIREIENVNGDWFFGCYMGASGLFPAPYVRKTENST